MRDRSPVLTIHSSQFHAQDRKRQTPWVESIFGIAGMTALELSADAGLLALFLATANICLGLLIAVRYSPLRSWPHRKINIFGVHQWTAYLLLTAIAGHLLLLFFVPRPAWRIADMVLPIHSPVQPLVNTIGAAAMYLTVVVVFTSYYRLQLGRRRWKLFHYLVYGAAASSFTHALFANLNLTDTAIDLLDGEKLFVEFCMAVVTVLTLWAWKYRIHKSRTRLGPTPGVECSQVSSLSHHSDPVTSIPYTLPR